MKLEDLRKKDKKELARLVADLKKKVSEIRFKQSSNQVKNVNEISMVKKEIAQMLTLINEKE